MDSPESSDPFDVVESLSGPTKADNEAHAMARVALMNRLVENETVLHIVDDWLYESGLGDLAVSLGGDLDRLAAAIGLPHRGHLACPPEGWDEVPAPAEAGPAGGLALSDGASVEEAERIVATVSARALIIRAPSPGDLAQ